MTAALPSQRRLYWIGVTGAALLGAVNLYLLPDVRGLFGWGLASLALAIALIDLTLLIIPNSLSAALCLLGLLQSWILADYSPMEALAAAMLRSCIMALAFFALSEIYFRIRKRQGIGMGDVKLAAGAGAWLEWQTIPVALEIAVVAAFAVLLVHSLRHRNVTLSTAIPFGLFLAPSVWIGWILQNFPF